MYLVIHHIDHGDDAYLFFLADPRPRGCTLPVIEGVEPHGLNDSTEEWQLEETDPGESRPFVLAQSRRAPKTYRLCRSELDVPTGFDVVTSSVEVWATWEAFQRGLGR